LLVIYGVCLPILTLVTGLKLQLLDRSQDYNLKLALTDGIEISNLNFTCVSSKVRNTSPGSPKEIH